MSYLGLAVPLQILKPIGQVFEIIIEGFDVNGVFGAVAGQGIVSRALSANVFKFRKFRGSARILGGAGGSMFPAFAQMPLALDDRARDKRQRVDHKNPRQILCECESIVDAERDIAGLDAWAANAKLLPQIAGLLDDLSLC